MTQYERKEHYFGRSDDKHRLHTFLSTRAWADSTIHVELSQQAGSLVLQAHGHHDGVSFHRVAANLADTPVSKIPGMDTARAGNEGATNGALHHLDCVLLRMLLHHEPVSHPTFHQQHPHHGTRHPDYLCAYQRLVEDINPLGSHRWRDRRIDVVCLVVSLQSYLVALFGHLIRGIGGVEPHHSQATHAVTGERWIHCGSDIRLLYYLNDLKSNS